MYRRGRAAGIGGMEMSCASSIPAEVHNKINMPELYTAGA